MCSVDGDDFFPENKEQVVDDEEIKICGKCKIKPGSIKLKLKNVMCDECFLNYVRHLFRASLGSTKIVRRDSNVLVHCNGTINNVCLIHMLKEAIEEPSHKRLHLNLNLVYVDEGFNLAERLDRLVEFQNIIKTSFSNIQCYYASLFSNEVDILDIKSVTGVNLSANETKFSNLLKSLKSETSRQDLLSETKRILLCKIAEKLECSYIFVSETGVELAKDLISNFALGKGSAASYNMAFCDDRVTSACIIRPFRTLDPLELEWYAKLKELKYLAEIPQSASRTSIQSLTSNFINGLQKNFPSTISTVFRTGEKIAPKPSANLNSLDSLRCSFCFSYLDCEGSDTLLAIEFSKLMSETANNGDDFNLPWTNNEASKDLLDGLCHGCRNIYNESGNKDLATNLLL